MEENRDSTYKLVVAEKPSVARDIAHVLGAKARREGYIEGNGYRVTWAVGHLVTLKEPEEIDPRWKKWSASTLPILPETLPLKVLPKTRSQYNIVLSLMRDKQNNEIICATDAGREGELIFRRIAMMAKVPPRMPMRRLWISSMTDEAIRGGFAKLKPLSDYDTLYESARCRSEADWLVGMNGTRAFTLRYDVLLSVGRVQTPTLAILVKRRREIESFKPENYFEVEADFGTYKGLWINGDGKTRLEEKQRAEDIAEKVRGKQARVDKSERERKRVPPPLLYDLTALQRDANKRYGMTAEQTLSAAQALYEKHKLITYPRTDSNYLPNDQRDAVRKAVQALPVPYADIAALIADPPLAPRRVYNDAGVTDHHAIIPTGRRMGNLVSAERDVYDLVVRRFLGALLPDYEYDALRAETVCEGERFLSLGQCPQVFGWKAAWNDPEETKEQNLPDLAVYDLYTVLDAKVLGKATKPPPPHTEASLLSAMERAGREIEDEKMRELMKDSGLGTPATRAAIIERLLQVGYVRRQGRALHATDKGVKLIGVVPVELSSPETTGRWEKGLASIRAGRLEPAKFMGSIRRFAAFLADAAAKSAVDSPFDPEERKKKGTRKGGGQKKLPGSVCPLCGGALTETEKAFGCIDWKTKGCKFTIWKNMAERSGGPPVTQKLVKELLEKGSAACEAGNFSMREGKAYFSPKLPAGGV